MDQSAFFADIGEGEKYIADELAQTDTDTLRSNRRLYAGYEKGGPDKEELWTHSENYYRLLMIMCGEYR